MYAQPIAGYPNNIWGTGYPYSNMNTQNNVTNIYANGGSTSIFGSSANVVNHVSMNNIMTAPFGAQQMSYSASYAPQQQTTDYTGKMMDMMMSMCMMMFQKKLNGDNSQTTEKPKVVIEDTGSSKSNKPTLDYEYRARKVSTKSEKVDAAEVAGSTAIGAGVGAAIGKVLIPIPGIGTAVGAAVGGAIGFFKKLFGKK